MMILVGMMSIAGVLAFSGGIGGFDILGSTDEEAADQATPPTEAGEDQGPEPDTVNGGNGNDLLFFDDGDTATGGDGRDAFVTDANPYDPNYEPVRITDFDRNDDTI